MSYQGDVPRLLYSSVPGPRDDRADLEESPEASLELELMRGDDCPGMPVRIVGRGTSDGRLSDAEVTSMARAVPPECSLVEIADGSGHLLGVVMAESDVCRVFLGPSDAYTLCLGRQMMRRMDDEDDWDAVVNERRPFESH